MPKKLFLEVILKMKESLLEQFMWTRNAYWVLKRDLESPI